MSLREKELNCRVKHQNGSRLEGFELLHLNAKELFRYVQQVSLRLWEKFFTSKAVKWGVHYFLYPPRVWLRWKRIFPGTEALEEAVCSCGICRKKQNSCYVQDVNIKKLLSLALKGILFQRNLSICFKLSTTNLLLLSLLIHDLAKLLKTCKHKCIPSIKFLLYSITNTV